MWSVLHEPTGGRYCSHSPWFLHFCQLCEKRRLVGSHPSPPPSVRRRHLHEAETGGVGEDVLEEAEGRDPLARPLVVPQEHQEAGGGALRDDPGGGGGGGSGSLHPLTPLEGSLGKVASRTETGHWKAHRWLLSRSPSPPPHSKDFVGAGRNPQIRKHLAGWLRGGGEGGGVGSFRLHTAPPPLERS